MIKDNKILINNIYHMLSYAFQTLKQENYKDVSIEPFDEMYDLFAAILSKGISFQLKHGLYKELKQYEITVDPTNTIYPLQHTIQQDQMSFVLLDQYTGNNKIDNANISTILNYGTDYVYIDNNKIKLSAGLIRNTRKLKFMVISFGV